MEDILFNKNLLLFLLTVSVVYMVWVILRTLWYYIKVYYHNNNSNCVHPKKFKIVWTTIPGLILFASAMLLVIYYIYYGWSLKSPLLTSKF
jgi:heme/copper-type cytochrome/quinol oxidase subunit 2